MDIFRMVLLAIVYSSYTVTLVDSISKGKDYYEILGITSNAKDREIKRAFRKLALKYHPDKNNDNPDAEAKFVEIAKAYEILSDPEKRNKYDRFGEAAFDNSNGGGPTYDFNDIFKNFDSFFDMGGGHHQHFKSGGDDFYDAFFEEDDEDEDMFGSMFDGFGGGDTFFGRDFGDFGFDFGHDQHHQHHTHHHQKHHSNHHHTYHSSHVHSGGSRNQRCKTVTKRVGNMVTTHTVCS